MHESYQADEVSLDPQNPLETEGDHLRKARGDRVRADTESTTLAGFSEMHVRTLSRMTAMHEAQIAGINARWNQREASLLAENAALRQSTYERESELQGKLSAGTATAYQSVIDMAALPAIVAEHGKVLLEAQAHWLDKMREPVEPRPTGTETAGDVIKHLFTEVANIANGVFSNNPEMRQRAQRLLGGAVERGEQLTGKEGPVEPGEPDAAPALDPRERRIDELPLKEVFAMFQGLPAEVLVKFAAENKIAEPFLANWRQMRALLAQHESRQAP